MNDNTLTSDDKSPNSIGQSSSLGKNLQSKSMWRRLFHMVVLGVLYSLSRLVVGAVITVQFFWLLFTQEKNDQLAVLGKSLATYGYQITMYLTFNTENRPYPYDMDWPDES